MKVIFLDFDGVISTYEKGWAIDNEKICLIKKIIDVTNAKIIVSSSWKVGFDDVDSFLDNLYGDSKNDMINAEDIFFWFVNNIYDITDSYGGNKGDEIQRWLNVHENDIENYVILDDDDDFLDDQLFHFVQTDGFEGITDREVKLCIKLLNGERIPNPLRLNLELMTRWRNNCKGLDGKNINTLLHGYHLGNEVSRKQD